MPVQRIPRLITGEATTDKWFALIAERLECALNITGSGPIAVAQKPSGNHLLWTGGIPLEFAKSGSGGIPAANGSGVPGSAQVNLQTFDGANAPVSVGTTDKAFNFGPEAVGPDKQLILGRVGRWRVVLWEVCS